MLLVKRTLPVCSFLKESMLHLALRLWGGMRCFVNTLTGKTFKLDSEAFDTINGVKTQEKEDIPPGLKFLVSPDRLIEDARLLPNCYTQKESVLHLVYRLWGGLRWSVNSLTGNTIRFDNQAFGTSNSVTTSW